MTDYTNDFKTQVAKDFIYCNQGIIPFCSKRELHGDTVLDWVRDYAKWNESKRVEEFDAKNNALKIIDNKDGELRDYEKTVERLNKEIAEYKTDEWIGKYVTKISQLENQVAELQSTIDTMTANPKYGELVEENNRLKVEIEELWHSQKNTITCKIEVAEDIGINTCNHAKICKYFTLNV